MGEKRNGSGRKPTLEDVARLAGVSRALVSIVIREQPGASDQTRARVLKVADEIGYRPDVRARMLARAQTRLLGVTYRVDSLHHADLLGPVYDAADAAGYEVILSATTRRHDERSAANTVIGYRCDAMLLLGPDSLEAEIGRFAATLPVIVVGRRLVHRVPDADVVRTDDVRGMRLAVGHLAGMGHQHIVLVGGGPGTIAADRRRGYRAGMAEAGLAGRVRIVEGGQTVDAGWRAAATVLAERPIPTAVIAFNDEAAWGVMRAAAKSGIDVPGDLSIVGYDGTSLSSLSPRELTTIRQDAESIGRTSVQRAVARITGSADGRWETVFPPSIVPGETTAPPRA